MVFMHLDSINWQNVTTSFFAYGWCSDCDLLGNDLEQLVATPGNINFCAEACSKHASCNHFTYAPDSSLGITPGYCW